MADNKTQIVITAVDQASASLQKVGGEMLSLAKAAEFAKANMAAIGGAVSVAGFAAIIGDAVKTSAALHDLSQQTGLTVETLSGLKDVAALSDTSLEQVATGAQKLVKNMSDAAGGGKEAQATFQALGVAVKNSSGGLRDVGDVYADVAKSIAAIESPTERVAAAQLAFGKSGAQLLPMLNDLATAGDLVVKVTARQAALADNVGDNWQKLGLIYSNAAKSIALEALPALDAFTESLLEQAQGTNGIRTALNDLQNDGSLKSWAEGAARAAGFVVDAFDGVVRVVKAVGITIGAAAAQAAALSQGNFKGLAGIGQDWLKDLDNLASGPLFSQRLEEKLRNGIGGDSAKRDTGSAFQSRRDALLALEDRTKSATKAADELAKLLDRINGKETGLDAGYWKDLDTLHAAYQAGKLTLDEYSEAVGKLTTQQKFYQDQLKAEEEAIKARNEYLTRAVQSEAQRAESVKKASDALRDEIATIGLSANEQAAYAAAKLETAAASELAAAAELENAAALLELQGVLPDVSAKYRELAEARRESAEAMKEQGGLTRERGVKKAADDARKEWEKTADSINNSLTDALLRGFESGKSFAENFRDTLKNMFQTLILRPVISAVLAPVAGGIASLLPGSAMAGQGGAAGSAGGIGNLFSTGNSLYNMATGGSGLYTSFATSGVGQALGLSAAGVGGGMAALGALGGGVTTAAGTGLALGGTTGLSVGAGLGSGVLAGSTLTAGTGTAIGAAAPALTALGTVVPVIGAIIAIAAALGAFGKKAKTPKINIKSGLVDEGWSNFDTPFGKISGAAKHTDDFAKIFDGLKPIAELDKIIAAQLSAAEIAKATKDIEGTGTGEIKSKKFSGDDFILDRLDRITDSIGGWINDLADTAQGEIGEVYAQTATILASRRMAGAEALAAQLMSESGAAFLRESETIAAGFTRMQQALEATRPLLAALNNTAIGRDAAGGNVASALVDAMGGLESFATSAGFFVEQFLTDAEKFKMGLDTAAENVRGAQQKLTEAFAEYGLTVPKTREDFKALARAIDLTSDAGREAFNALMQVAPAFDAVADAVEKMTSQKTGLLAKVTQTATGTPGLADFNALLKPFGIAWDRIISREEAATALNSMDASNPANAWFFALSEQLEPMLSKVWESQETAAKDAADVMARAQEEAARAAEDAARAAADEWESLTADLGDLQSQYADLQREYQRAVYQEQIDGLDLQLTAAETAASAARDALNNWERAAKALADWRDSLLGDLASPLGGGYANALSRFTVTAAQARSGSIDAMGNLPGVGKSLLDASRDAAKTKLDYARDYAKVLATADETQGIAQDHVSVAQQQLNAALSQVDWLKKQKDAIEELMDSGEKNTDRIRAEMLVVEGQIAAVAAALGALGSSLGTAFAVVSGGASGSSAGAKPGGSKPEASGTGGSGEWSTEGYRPGSRTLTDAELFAYGFHPSERGNLDRLGSESNFGQGNAYDYIQSELGQFSFLSNAYGLKSSDFDDRQKLALWEQYTKGAGAVRNGLTPEEIAYIKSDAFKDVTVSASTIGQVMLDLNNTGAGTSISTTYNGTAYTEADIQGAAKNIIDAGGTMLDVYAAAKASNDSGSGVNLAMVSDALGFSSADLSKWLDENDLPGFAVGTNYVPSDMVANIHEGERIIPAADNRALMRALNGGNDQAALIESLIEEVRLLRAEARATASHTAETNRKLRDMSPDGTRLEVVVSA